MKSRHGRLRYAITAAFVALAGILCYASASNSSAQGTMTGEWILEMRPGTDFVYFSIHPRGEQGGEFLSSSVILADSIKGLSAAQAAGTGSPVSFQVVRDAGTLNCEGWFKQGKGSRNVSVFA